MKLLILTSLLALYSCSSMNGQKAQQSSINKNKIETVLKKGTPQSVVIENFGSPNTVSSDGSGAEVWSYLRRSTNSEHNSATLDVFKDYFHLTTWGYTGAHRHTDSSSAQDSSLIVYFDKNKKVRSFNFRSEIY